jgi:uncharacterized membrane protein YadS
MAPDCITIQFGVHRCPPFPKVFVLAYAIYWAGRGQAEAVTNKAASSGRSFPQFILGFLLISPLVSFHAFNKGKSPRLAISQNGHSC